MIFNKTHVGCERIVNEDVCVSFVHDSEDIAISVVCDGIGGAQGGEIASLVAANAIVSHITKNISATDANDIGKLLREAFEFAHKSVISEAERCDKNGMGTTALCAVVIKDRAFLANIGDSRAYVIKNGLAVRITRDHSVVWNMVEKGEISEEQARIHPVRNLITKALGTDEWELDDSDIYELTLKPDELLLLCTDGLYSLVFPEEIPDLIKNSDNLENACEKLIALANSRGGYDNITVSIINTEGVQERG